MVLYNETLGSVNYDNIINSGDFPIVTGMKVIAAGQGLLKRGTALAMNEEEKLVILGTEGAAAHSILADNADATEEVLAEIYIAGHFNRNALITKDNEAITDEQAEEYRKLGIYLDNVMKK